MDSRTEGIFIRDSAYFHCDSLNYESKYLPFGNPQPLYCKGVMAFAFLLLIILCLPGTSTPILKSCGHLRDADYSSNGYYSIDPDGSGTGVEPFAVYCDMTKGMQP